jgi:hypothetical protein
MGTRRRRQRQEELWYRADFRTRLRDRSFAAIVLRGKQNVEKRLLLQAAGCNLALLLRKMMGAGTPRALQDVAARLVFILLRLLSTINAFYLPRCSLPACTSRPHRTHVGESSMREIAD